MPSESLDTLFKFDPDYSIAEKGKPQQLGKDIVNLRTITVYLRAKQTVTVHFGVASGSWKTLLDTTVGSVSGGIDRNILFSRAFENDGNVVVVVTHDIKDRVLQVVAVGKDGQEYPSSCHDAGAGTTHQITATFSKLSLKEIKSFRLQARPYQWIEFRNVSLHPGQKTDVQIVLPESSTESIFPITTDKDLRVFIEQAQRLIESKNYLNAHVALRRIEKLGRMPDYTQAYAKHQSELKQLSQQVSENIDLKAVEYHDEYVLYRKASWTDQLKSLKGQRGVLVMRVFLEEPSLSDIIQLSGERNCNMMQLRSTSDGYNGSLGAFLQISDGNPAIVNRLNGDNCSFRIGTLHHSSPIIEATIPAGKATALGDIVLLRPKEEMTGRLILFLEASQAEMEKANFPKANMNNFLIGRVTAGGIYGQPLTANGIDGLLSPPSDVALLTPGKLWLVWAANPRQRWQIDISAGKTTEVRFHLDSSGKLADPQIARTPLTTDYSPPQLIEKPFDYSQ